MAEEEDKKPAEEASAAVPEGVAAPADQPQAKAEAEAPDEKKDGEVKASAPASAAAEESEEQKKPEAKETADTEKPEKDNDEKKAEGEGKGEDKASAPQTAEEVFLALEGGEDKPKILKAKGSKNVHAGIVHVLATYNNTKVSVTDLNGNVIGWSSSGKLGFKGSRKSTAYAAQLVSQDACRQAMSHGLKTVQVRVKGPGSGRESAVRAVQNLGIEVTLIRDVTPVPHNGCRPRKPRRV